MSYIQKIRPYLTANRLGTIAYNIMIVTNIKAGEKLREIMKYVRC
jgi:hypothetical protein